MTGSSGATAARRRDPLVLIEMQQFLSQEAHLLDERRFEEWLALFTDDVRYWMPTVSTPSGTRAAIASETDLAWFDDDLESLALRVRRLSTGEAHAETPPSRTRRIIGTILVKEQSDNEVLVSSNFMLYRTRRERDQEILVGNREDRLRRVDGAWRIARRRIIVDQNILASQNLSVFF